jgi:PIN domain nuclease of toxin-antitoxin system
MLNLDTHILIHALIGNLTRRERDLLAADEWGISDIVIWEISKLAQLGRIEINIDDVDLTRLLAGVQVWPISLDICRAIRLLDFRGDPADEIIAATTLVYKAPLLTRDGRIRKSKVVALADKPI